MNNEYFEWQNLTIQNHNGIICHWVVTICEYCPYLLHNNGKANGWYPENKMWYWYSRRLDWDDYVVLDEINFIELYLSNLKINVWNKND